MRSVWCVVFAARLGLPSFSALCSEEVSVANTALPVLVIVSQVLSVGIASAATWQVERTSSGDAPGGCVLVSEERSLHDGYIQTPIQIRVTPTRVWVITDSTIDPSYPNQGLTVDDNPRIEPDTPFPDGGTNARFDGDAELLIEQFKRGFEAEVALGFWPTWPMTETKVASFSLRGFTAAFGALRACLGERVDP